MFDTLAPSEHASTIGGLYDALIAREPESIRGFVCDASFFDVGTPADYWRTSHAFGAMAAIDASPSVGARARIDPTARVTRSILWDDVQVGAGAIVDECIVTDRVTVPAGSTHRRRILVAGANSELRAETLEL